VVSNEESHLDAMEAGDEMSLTETAAPVLQNLGREMSWIDATAGVAILTVWEVLVELRMSIYLRAGADAHICPLELYCWWDDN
jgi:hypothetical protein